MGFLLLLLASIAGAKSYPLKSFDSLFVRGRIIVTAEHGGTNQAVAKLPVNSQSNLEVVQVKNSVFIQMNPYKKIVLKHPVHVVLHYTTPLKRLTALQKASIVAAKVSGKSLRVSGSGEAYIKVVKVGKVKKLLVHLTRKSVADLSPLAAAQCDLRIAKGSHLLKQCSK